ncbi:MAG: class I SAM-dependent RNA methyltransferase [Candidatus Kapabacteria bacterium]|nr:class I SAM-dependent RNA methyltransferase [Candidatus Kapabacteria bacterium]
MNTNDNQFELSATTLYGLEPILADELSAIGAENIEIQNRAITFTGTKETMYRANLEIRTALRILKPIYSFRVLDEIDLYKETFKFNWEKYLDPKTTFAINSAVHSENFNHENYVALKVKDAMVDQLRTIYGKRPDVDIEDPDIRFHVHINQEDCTISLDSSGESLHKRGYRIGQGLAPINEVLAAGMIKLTGWNADSNFVDPMCGSGTFLMEAATIAYNIAPGVKRDFGFMNWKDFDDNLWRKLLQDAKDRERDFSFKILGFDESPKAINIAKDNIKNAELGWKILLKVKNIQDLEPDILGGSGTAIINPPYGERLNETDTERLYKIIGDSLKQNFEGFSVWIISSNKQALKNIGLRTSKKLTLYNGSLECKFHNYQIYKGSKKSKFLTNE